MQTAKKNNPDMKEIIFLICCLLFSNQMVQGSTFEKERGFRENKDELIWMTEYYRDLEVKKDSVMKKIRKKYPLVKLSEEFSLILDSVLKLEKNWIRWQYKFLKGYTVVNETRFEKKEGIKKHLLIVENYNFSKKNSITLDGLEGVMIKDGKLILFLESTVDGENITFTGDSVDLVLKRTPPDKCFGKIAYKVKKVKGKDFVKRNLHKRFLVINPPKSSLKILKYDGNKWKITYYCSNLGIWRKKVLKSSK